MNTLTQLLQQNPDVDIRTFDPGNPDTFAGLNFLPDVDRADQLAWLQGYRRLLRLTDHKQTALALFARGLHSVFQITELARARFIREYGDDCAPGEAPLVYDRAVTRKGQVVQTFAAVQQARDAHYRAGAYDNLSGLAAANFNGVPGYDLLFGNLDYCTCPDCRTVFSPAAYFVDLMRMQAKYIDFVGDADGAQYFALESRRPDLWKIPLDCANTNTLVPTIEIVNEVLIASLPQDADSNSATATPEPQAGPATDDPNPDDSTALYTQLTTAVYPFALPFNRPLDEISTVLARENANLAEVWDRITPDQQRTDSNWKKAMQLARLGLSPERWKFCTSGFSNSNPQAKAWGYQTSTSIAGLLADADTLMERAALSPVELRELVYENLTDETWQEEAPNFFINMGTADPIALEDVDGKWTVANLNGDRTSRINRFIRLSRFLGWTFSDLDWALICAGRLNGQAKAAKIDAAGSFLAWLTAMRQTHPEMSIDELCALQGTLKNYGTKSSLSFQDRVYFNSAVPNRKLLASYLEDEKAWQVPELNPASDSAPDEDSLKIQAALSGALALSVDELLFIATNMLPVQMQAAESPSAASDPATDRDLYINVENLGTLYRCSRLGRLSELSLPEVFTALALPGAPDNALEIIFTPVIAEADNKGANKKLQPVLEWLVAYGEWIRRVPFSTFELEYLLTGRSKDPRIQNRTLGLDALKNFYDEFQENIADGLLTPEKFAGALGDVAGLNQYNTDAQKQVYDGLTQAGYVDGDGKVPELLIAKPALNGIVVEIFPEGTSETDAVVEALSKALHHFLKTYRKRQKEDEQTPALDETVFADETRSIFADAMSSDYLPALLWAKIVAGYASNGIVQLDPRQLSVDAVDQLREQVAPLLFVGQRATDDDENFLANITRATVEIVVGFLETQQLTFARELAALYDISPDRFAPLLLTVPAYRKEEGKDKFAPLTLSDMLGDFDVRLAAALAAYQPYVLLVATLNLSAAALATIAANPAAFGITVASPATSPQFLNDANVRILVAFQALQRDLNDSQNRLLNYFSVIQAAGEKASPETAAPLLAEITGWNEEQILFLIKQLWSDDKASLPAYGTVAGLDLLARWFAQGDALDLDASTLWQLYSLADAKADYDTYAGVAGTLWGQLGRHYADDPAELRATRAAVGVRTRDVLAPYVLFQLREAGLPGVSNARDLSNYFLMDVQVGAEPETSPIGSAIASVQLYTHRCLNNLEPDIVLLDEFESWWEWLANYRVWEANRRVFLFPENYIEPELRHDKTPLFTDLENDLQSADLRNADEIDAALRAFLNGLGEVADLEIVGSGGYDYLDVVDTGAVEDGVGVFAGKATKTFCLVGRTPEEPHSYFYRLVTFLRYEATGQYVPVRWEPWREFPHSPTPVSLINPVFAFGKWFLFWVECEQTGRTPPEGDDYSNTKAIYTSHACTSYRNFNGEWSAPERKEVFSGPHSGKTSTFSILPSSIPAAQLIAVAIRATDSSNSTEKDENLLFYGETNGLRKVARYACDRNLYSDGLSDVPIKSSTGISYSYWLPIKKGSNQFNFDHRQCTFSAWVMPATGGENDRDDNPVFNFKAGWFYILNIYQNDSLAYNNKSGKTPTPIASLDPNVWNQVTAGYVEANEKNISKDRLPRPDQKRIFVACRGAVYFSNLTGDKKTLQVYRLGESADGAEKVAEIKRTAAIASRLFLVEYAGRLYTYWRETENNKIRIGQVNFVTGAVDNIQTLTEDDTELDLAETPQMLAVPDGENPILYISCVPDQKACLARLDPDTGELTEKQELVDSGGDAIESKNSPTLVWAESALYLAFKKDDTDFQFGKYTGAAQVEDYAPVALDGAPKLDWAPGLLYSGGTVYVTLFRGELYSFKLSDTKWKAKQLYDFSENNNAGGGNAFELNGQVVFPVTPTDTTLSLTLQLLPGINVYLNDRLCLVLVLRASHKLTQVEIGHGVGDPEPRFRGYMQNVLLFDRVLTRTEKKKLFENSLRFLTRAFQDVVFDQSGEPNDFAEQLKLAEAESWRIIVDQPGWKTCLGAGIRLLTGFQKWNDDILLSCYRLNSTATAALDQALFMGGAEKLLSVPSQLSPEIPFSAMNPNPETIPPATWPADRIDTLHGPMSIYYRELFFFAPFLTAALLKTDRRHATAKEWFEYIFDPTVNAANWQLQPGDVAQDRYWRYLGLRSGNNPVLKKELSLNPSEQSIADVQNAAQLFTYHNDPFDPHAIAGLRPIAYQKTIVMHYVRNLIDWGDVLFRRYTRESLGEAFMLYTTAYDLLGKDPVDLGECELPPVENLEDFVQEYDSLENIPEFLIGLEDSLPAANYSSHETPVNDIAGSYFGLPENEDFLACWGTVQERLFNISHGLNIDGVRQKAALFEPALNPARLVEQLGAGGGLGESPSALQTPVPYYRFSVMLQIARSTVQSVIQYGQSLLSALEKKDAEQLSLMSNQNQLTLLQQTTGSKQAQLDSLKESLAAQEFGLRAARDRLEYYTDLIGRGLSIAEMGQVAYAASAMVTSGIANATRIAAVPTYSIPTVFGLAAGGMSPGDSISESATITDGFAGMMNMQSNLLGTAAGFARRAEEWRFQQNLARTDVDQVQRQIDATRYQLQAAEEEVKQLKKSIDLEQEVQRFLKNKFTNAQLYQWFAGRLSGQYFQLYQVAYEQALQAQQAWRFEKGADPDYIRGGYWDSLHEGLLAGESLLVNLAQMENAFLQQNRRRFEIEKTISLGMEQSDALIQLRETGECLFELSEDLFDRDFPGHYCRQIASVAVSLPTLIGPYQNVHATLTQLRNSTRLEPDLSAATRDDVQVNQQIALSQGLNDAGLFTLNFADERYLPFEGTGAVSVWKLSMPRENNPSVDIDNLTDVIVQLNYTALPGPPAFAKQVRENLTNKK